jgi:hypothetical protein
MHIRHISCSLDSFIIRESRSSHIRSRISFRLNVNGPPVSLSSSSSRVSSLTSSSVRSSPSLVGGDLGAQSPVRRLSTSLPSIHAQGNFQKLVEDCMAFWIVLQNKTSFGVKSVVCKKDLLNLIRKYKGLVNRVAFPKIFGGVN